MNLNGENIVPPPNINTTGRKFIKSVGKRGDDISLILDCEILLDEDVMINLKNSNY